MIWIWSFCVIILIIACSKTVEIAAFEERDEDESERIVRGNPAQEGQFPWMVALYYNGQFVCTGSIIAQQVVLTSAHCAVFRGTQQPAYLYHGIANVNKSEPFPRIEFTDITIHPGYDELHDDLAILHTTSPITFNKTVHPVCIAGPNTAEMQYVKATAMGYGRTDNSNNDTADILQWSDQKIVLNSVCQYLNPGIDEKKICAKGFSIVNGGFNGICHGDSGGPLVHLSSSKPAVQIGVASYINDAFGCGSVLPAVWLRVSKYYDFILQTVADKSICVV